MEKKKIETSRAPAAIGPYSQAVEAGNLIFISGQLPVNPADGAMEERDIKKQTARVLDNIKAVLESAGLGMENLVKTTVLMEDLSLFTEMNEVYASYFASDPPARAAFEVKALPKGAMIEIEAVALK